MKDKGTLYLIPVTLGDTPINQVVPVHSITILSTILIFISMKI